MRGRKLDRIDKKILRNLQSNGRMSNVDLAKDVGISAPPCLRRVRALEQNGYIQSYHAKINPEILGYGVRVFAMVKLASQAEKDLSAFEDLVKTWDCVQECHILSGDVDFLLKIIAKDWDSYQEFFSTNLTSAPNVVSVKSSLGIRTTKSSLNIPIDE